MSEPRDRFCQLIKDTYPDISAKADRDYRLQWGEYFDEEYYSYTWFESLSNALNDEMKRGIEATLYSDLFRLISDNYIDGDDVVRECIDVAFVENLFWKVKKENVVYYWAALPINLKELYVGFHGKNPL